MKEKKKKKKNKLEREYQRSVTWVGRRIDYLRLSITARAATTTKKNILPELESEKEKKNLKKGVFKKNAWPICRKEMCFFLVHETK